MTTLLESFVKKKEFGDVARIARVVNAKRVDGGAKVISNSYVGMMLDGKRRMTDEVREVAVKYFEVQEKLQKELIA